MKSTMTVKSWTMAGKRSEGRSSRHGLAISVIAALTIARTIVRRASADRSWTSPSPWRAATSSSAKPRISQAENSSRPRT
jgi:hypothetical protein